MGEPRAEVGVRVGVEVCIPFYIVQELQTKETLCHLSSLFLWGDWSWGRHAMGGGVGHRWPHLLTTPCCCLCLPILQDSSLPSSACDSLYPTPPHPVVCIFFTSPPLEQLIWMGGGEASFLREYGGKGAALFCHCIFWFCLHQAGMGWERGLSTLYQNSLIFP